MWNLVVQTHSSGSTYYIRRPVYSPGDLPHGSGARHSISVHGSHRPWRHDGCMTAAPVHPARPREGGRGEGPRGGRQVTGGVCVGRSACCILLNAPLVVTTLQSAQVDSQYD